MSGVSATATFRDAFRERVEAKGHAVENVRAAIADLEQAIERGDVRLTPPLEQTLTDIHVALEQDADQKLGGKRAEAARFISRAMLRELDRQVTHV